MELLADLLQFAVGLRPVQLLQDAAQVAQLLCAQRNLPGQLLLGVLHPGVVLVEFGGVLLGGEDGAEGDLNGGHVFVVEVLTEHLRLALLDAVEVGGEDVPQLAQPLPVQGGGQLLFLELELPGQALAAVMHGFAQGLALLAHGILPVPQGVEAVQKAAEALRSPAAAVLFDGAEGELLGGAVGGCPVPGGGGGEGITEKDAKLFRSRFPFQRFHPGVDVPGGEQGGLPADQGGQAAQGIHQPLGKHIGPRGAENGAEILCCQIPGIPLLNGLGGLVVQSRQGGAAGLVQADPTQAVQDPAVGAKEVHIAGSAHQLHHQALLDGVAHLIRAVEGEFRGPLHGDLGDAVQPCPQKVLAQEHTEHGRLGGILRGGGGQVQPGGGGVGGDQQLFPPPLAAQQKDEGVPAGLKDLLHPGSIAPLPDLIQHGGQIKRVKGHGLPPFQVPGRTAG